MVGKCRDAGKRGLQKCISNAFGSVAPVGVVDFWCMVHPLIGPIYDVSKIIELRQKLNKCYRNVQRWKNWCLKQCERCILSFGDDTGGYSVGDCQDTNAL